VSQVNEQDSDITDRTLRAFAYLSSQLDQPGVHDVIDCLKPFLVRVITADPSKPVNVAQVAGGLAEFGLEIPYYALEQIIPRLQEDGILVWDAALRSHLVHPDYKAEANSGPALDDGDFRRIDAEIERFAAALGLKNPTVSDSWNAALIRFLKSDYTGKSEVIELGNTKVFESGDVERYAIARFVQEMQLSNPDIFEAVRRVYAGVLIEDFIQNIQFVGSDLSYQNLAVFYDTSIILRILGTSGGILRDATLEMHKGLQELGARTYILSRTRTEVEGIIETLIGHIAKGREIYGETADAISEGEVSAPRIRKLALTYMAELTALGISEFDYNFSHRTNEDVFQIDEKKFSELLRAGARKNDRGYSLENAENDAIAVAITMRLRKGRAARTLGASRYLFLSRNKLLQSVSREYAAEQTDSYDYSSVPPVLSTGQVTTAAWLATSKKFEGKRVTKELLASCFSAVQPDKDWAEEFAKLLGQYRTDNPEEFASIAAENLTLQNLRRLARDESLNEGSVVGKINLAKLMAEERERAADAAQKQKLEMESAVRVARDEEAARLQAALEEANRDYNKSVSQEAARAGELERERISERIARVIEYVVFGIIILAFVLALISREVIVREASPLAYWFSVCVTGFLTVIFALDSFGIPFMRSAQTKLRERIKAMILKVLA